MSDIDPKNWIDPETGNLGCGARPSCLGSEYGEARQDASSCKHPSSKEKERGK